MDVPTYRGHAIIADIPHVDIEIDYKTIIGKLCFPFAIVGKKCLFVVKFENIHDRKTPPNFEYKFVKDGDEDFWNLYGVHLPHKGSVDIRCFRYTPETSGEYKLYIRVPRSDNPRVKVGFHNKDRHFENDFSIKFVTYSKRKIITTIAKIVGIIVAPFTIAGVILRLMQMGII